MGEVDFLTNRIQIEDMSKERVYKVVVNQCGDTRWYNDQDQLHREGGPAIEWASGYKAWYLNGVRHREDGI